MITLVVIWFATEFGIRSETLIFPGFRCPGRLPRVRSHSTIAGVLLGFSTVTFTTSTSTADTTAAELAPVHV